LDDFKKIIMKKEKNSNFAEKLLENKLNDKNERNWMRPLIK